MSLFDKFGKVVFVLRLLGPLADRLTQPAIQGVKQHIFRLLTAVALVATGVACLVIALSYFAASLWHALAPLLGIVGADLVLGSSAMLVAVVLLVIGFRALR